MTREPVDLIALVGVDPWTGGPCLTFQAWTRGPPRGLNVQGVALGPSPRFRAVGGSAERGIRGFWKKPIALTIPAQPPAG